MQNYAGSTLLQTWTLSIEEHFYFFLAFLFLLVSARHLTPGGMIKLFLAIGALVIVARCVTAGFGNFEGARRWTQNRIDGLLLGVVLATAKQMLPDLFARLTSRAWPLILAVGFGLAFDLTAGDHFLMRGPGYTILYLAAGAFVLLVETFSRQRKDWMLYRLISWIGVYSYALYLWHSITLSAGAAINARYVGVGAWVLAISIQISLSLIVAYAATRLVEWPFLRWRESIPGLRDKIRLVPAQPALAGITVLPPSELLSSVT